MIRAVSAIAFIIELAVVPCIVVTVTIAPVITTATEDAVGRFILPFLSQVIKNGCANKYIKESHKIIDLRLISSSCHLSHDFYYQP